MRSWLPTQASTDFSLRVTLDRRRLAALLAPLAAVGDTATLRVTPDELAVRAADDARVQAVTTRLDADACHQYAVTPGQLTFDPTTLRAALTADAATSAETDRSRSRTPLTTRPCRCRCRRSPTNSPSIRHDRARPHR